MITVQQIIEYKNLNDQLDRAIETYLKRWREIYKEIIHTTALSDMDIAYLNEYVDPGRDVYGFDFDHNDIDLSSIRPTILIRYEKWEGGDNFLVPIVALTNLFTNDRKCDQMIRDEIYEAIASYLEEELENEKKEEEMDNRRLEKAKKLLEDYGYTVVHNGEE